MASANGLTRPAVAIPHPAKAPSRSSDAPRRPARPCRRRRRCLRLPGVLAWLLFILLPGAARSAAQSALEPLRVDTPPVIDGRLDDPVWRTAPSVSGFRTFSPDFGREGSEQTTAFMAYDSRNLYFAFQCLDREPGKIKCAVSSRDSIPADDWVCINLDSFNDQQSLYAFYVNPAGIQMDSRYSAGREDFSADFVWQSAGRKDSTGYTVEIAIPLQSIRYAKRNPVLMSVFFERYISRLSEHSSYPEMDPAKGFAFLTQMKTMSFENLGYRTIFELLPAFTFSQKYNREEDHLVMDDRLGELSLTTKYGLTSDLILDGTFNPDFSQVESDAGQVDVNLRYSLFYPEKRPFFLEGNEIFNLAATQVSEVDPVVAIFYSRSIVDPITGIKLSGKIGSRNTIASLYAMDELPPEDAPVLGEYAHFPIIRYKRTLYADSYLGGIYTGRFARDHTNQVAGVDGLLRITEASTIEYNGLLSGTQTDDNSLHDVGHTAGVKYSYNTRNLDFNTSFKEVSPDFNAETGYITRTGIMTFAGLARPKFYPRSDFFQRIDAEVFSAQTRDEPSGRWETFNHFSVQAFFLGTMTVKGKYSYSTEIFSGERFKTGGGHFLISGQFTRKLNMSLLYRRVNSIYYSQEPFQGMSNRITAEAIYQPTEKIESDLSFVYSDLRSAVDGQKMYAYPILRERLTYQLNKYLFFRGIVEYNKYRRRLTTDFLASFTYVPGTGVHLGYGSLYEKTRWEEDRYVDGDDFQEIKRGLFFKVSYLWRW